MMSPLEVLRRDCSSLPTGDAAAEAATLARQEQLTKPPGSLGRLEAMAAWLARWQNRGTPRVERVSMLVFAGNHGVTARNVSPYPAAVTGQMVANFASGGAAINQLADLARAELSVVALNGLEPTADLSVDAAMTENGFLAAVRTGREAVGPDIDLLCLGEMGIGNTTAAAALSAALFGGAGRDWAGRGAGLDEDGVMRKAAVVDRALRRHGDRLHDPLEAARRVGGYEMAAILGATLESRRRGIPVLLDGFVCTAAAAVLEAVARGGLDHAMVAHRSAESGHGRLLSTIGKMPILELGMRLGEGSGTALAATILRAACACLNGMATFAEAGVGAAV